MSTFKINPGNLKGKIVIPPSKSHTLRGVLLAMMGKKQSIIFDYLHSPDTEMMIKAISMLGAKVEKSQNCLKIQGVEGELKSPDDVIDCKNSGQVLRFISAFAAFLPTYTILTGDESIRHKRPMQPLIDGLKQLGAFIVSSRLDGFAPIIVRGRIDAGQTAISGEDSQPVSALLMASSFLKEKTTVLVKNPGEKAWIDLTLDWLSFLGLPVINHAYEKYEIMGNGHFDSFEKKIPGDLSSAAYPVAAAIITNSEITLENVDFNDVQGDKKFINILIQMGAKIDFDEKKKSLVVNKGSNLQGIAVDINDCIDMVTILPVVASFAQGKTEITGAKIARSKECNRLQAITSELKKMGGNIEETDDGLIIFPAELKGANLETFHDHRMVLALSVAALAAKGTSVINDVESINKTYPSFKQDFVNLGALIT